MKMQAIFFNFFKQTLLLLLNQKIVKSNKNIKILHDKHIQCILKYEMKINFDSQYLKIKQV